MSTVRQHLGLLWLMRRSLMTQNPHNDRHWEMQAAFALGVHLDEFIALAGGADIEDWVRNKGAEIPADFPHSAGQSPAPVTAEPVALDLSASGLLKLWEKAAAEATDTMPAPFVFAKLLLASPQPAAQVPSIERDAIRELHEQAASVLSACRGYVQKRLDEGTRTGDPIILQAGNRVMEDLEDTIRALKGQPAAAHAAKTDEQREREQIEARAKEIYSTFPYAHLFPWSERFNSIKQDEARAKARAELKSAAHAAHDQKGGGNA